MYVMFQICTLLILITSTLQLCDNNFCNCTNQTCSSCLTPSMYSMNNTCLPCPFQCSTCTSGNTCTACVASYYLANNTCNPCNQYCYLCNNQTCLKCIDGYGLASSGCVRCSISNALSCQGADLLVACQSGFWQNGNSCSPCRQFCLICSSSSNCLQCQAGYQVSVSFGSYCSKCPTGCSACSNSICSSCLKNYYLSNGACIDITVNCTNIPNCQSCQLVNNSVSCYSCYYPYYVKSGVCQMGASLLCTNGASGPLLYQCLNGCSSSTYTGATANGAVECLPLLWVGSTQQLYYNAYSPIFNNLYKSANEWIYMNQDLSSSSQSVINLQFSFNPYYKLVYTLKLVSVGLAAQNLTTSIILTDNSSNIQSFSFNITPQSNNSVFYLNFKTKTTSEQIVNLSLSSTANSSAVVVGLAECIVQVYTCPTNCRLCFNAQLCSQCYSNYFSTPQYLCVSSCIGYLQLYMPYGNASNYTYKQCVASCPSTFYPFILNTTYICFKCVGPCLTCLSSTQCLTCVTPYIYYEITFSCLTSCPVTHYQTNNTCTPCSIPCATCISLTICLSCSVGYFSNRSCLTTCPIGTFQDSTNNLCSNCDSKCASCEGSSTYCLSCNSPFLLFGSSCLSKCLSSIYYVESNTCQMCVSPCQECKNKISCTSCISGYLFGDSCLSSCPSGYYADSSDLTCKICQNGCLTCESQNICLSCPKSTFLYSYSCITTCVVGTYSSNRVCVTCIQPCASCTNSTYCLSCSIGYLSQLSPGNCLPSCEQGYYSQISNLTCLKCLSPCKTCLGSQSACISCESNLLLYGQSCLSMCPKGYYKNSGTCLLCAFPCSSCEISDYNCTACQSNYILNNFDCIAECPTFTYLNVSTCSNCIYPCLTCISADSCLTCPTNKTNQTFLINNKCLTSCPQGYYAEISSLTCKNCSYPCSTCISNIACLTCSFGYLNSQTSTCGLCDANMFINETSKTCQLCNSSISGCLNCLSSNECILCATGLYLFNVTCITQLACNSKYVYYIDTQLQQCVKCSYPCLTCLNATYCSSCSSGYLWMGSCLSSCLSNYYEKSGICQACSSICLTCSNFTACLTCNTSSSLNTYYPDNLTCISASSCPSGYYLDSTFGALTCTKCVSPCLSCTNSTYCLTCSSGLNYKGSCKSNCPTSYYADISNPTDSKCSACSSVCFSCMSNATNCTSCYTSFYLKNGSCVSNCGQAYYLDSTIFQCFSCISPCYSCSGASTCISCRDSSYILYYGQCLTVCPDGTYNSNQTCQICPSSCFTCYKTNSTQPVCIQCISTMYMSMSQPGVCLSKCQSNQYGDANTRKCYNCISPCLSCTNAISCMSCIDNYLRYKTQCLAITRCPSGSYLLNRTCLNDCGTLWAVDSTAVCSNECAAPALKLMTNMKRCVLSCPQNYFVDYSYTCMECSGQLCTNLLSLTIQVKSIFNILYTKISFNKNINLSLITPNTVKINLTPLQSTARLLQNNPISFEVSTVNINAVWLKLAVNQSVSNSLMVVTFSDYYVLGPPLQNLSYKTDQVVSFDLYNSQQQSMGMTFQKFSQILSATMIVIFVTDLVLNSGHLSYLIIDYYQLLFMVLFLSIDYPPHLNHFLYGFRYSHYLFLPQIFRTTPSKEYSSYTPDKFGVVVPDVYFLNNTGQIFIIVGSSVGLLVLSKLVQMLIRKLQGCKNNRIKDVFMQKKEQQEKSNRLLLFLQAIVARFKWNYFNDTIYTIYFSLMLFAFSQIYDLTWRENAIIDLISIVLAFLFILCGCLFPLGLGWFLYKEKDNLVENSLQHQKQMLKSKAITQKKAKKIHLREESDLKQKSQKISQHQQHQPQAEQLKNYEILTDFKCFVSGIKLKVKMGFYHIPIRYFKKLIFACLLVYCSQFPSLVLGLVMMTCLIDMLIVIALKPYRLSFEQILYPIFDGLYLLIFFTICIMQLPILDLSQSQKLNASYLAIALCIFLSLLLAIHNIVMNVVQIAKFFCKIDYLSKYYQTEYVQTTQEEMTSEHQHTNTPLVKQVQRQISIKQEKVDSDSLLSGLDIYLKKEHNAPQYLIKCLKKPQETSQQNNAKQQEEIIKVYDYNFDEEHSWNKQNQGEDRQKKKQQQSDIQKQSKSQQSNIFDKLVTLDIDEHFQKD